MNISECCPKQNIILHESSREIHIEPLGTIHIWWCWAYDKIQFGANYKKVTICIFI